MGVRSNPKENRPTEDANGEAVITNALGSPERQEWLPILDVFRNRSELFRVEVSSVRLLFERAGLAGI